VRVSRFIILFVGYFLLAFSSACSAAIAKSATVVPIQVQDSPSPTATSLVVTLSPLPKFSPSPKASETPNPVSQVSCKIATPQDESFAPKRSPKICEYDFLFPLNRPIAPPARVTIDASYRYGSTQNGQRDPHHGVEFINKAGVPVLAAADGVAVVAGNDLEEEYAMETNFYGNLVILEHRVPGFSQPIYTLYGHLLEVDVKQGAHVRSGDQIGKVGLGGVAAGTHLHFEVRFAKNAYNATRNPQLWLKPLKEGRGEIDGVLSGRFVDKNGNFQMVDGFILQPLDSSGNDNGSRIYVTPYEDDKMIGLEPWRESFGIGDLSPGLYRLYFVYIRPVEFIVEVLPGEITDVTFIVE
jgi:murein DD-endopeptidase MepM/ murein hydrolase activator NlpD